VKNLLEIIGIMGLMFGDEVFAEIPGAEDVLVINKDVKNLFDDIHPSEIHTFVNSQIITTFFIMKCLIKRKYLYMTELFNDCLKGKIPEGFSVEKFLFIMRKIIDLGYVQVGFFENVIFDSYSKLKYNYSTETLPVSLKMKLKEEGLIPTTSIQISSILLDKQPQTILEIYERMDNVTINDLIKYIDIMMAYDMIDIFYGEDE
jgi:hypothetical protein